MNVDTGNDTILYVGRFGGFLFLYDTLTEDVGFAKLLYALPGLHIASLAEFLQSKDVGKINVTL